MFNPLAHWRRAELISLSETTVLLLISPNFSKKLHCVCTRRGAARRGQASRRRGGCVSVLSLSFRSLLFGEIFQSNKNSLLEMCCSYSFCCYKKQSLRDVRNSYLYTLRGARGLGEKKWPDALASAVSLANSLYHGTI
jgi:hypothetical protein